MTTSRLFKSLFATALLALALPTISSAASFEHRVLVRGLKVPTAPVENPVEPPGSPEAPNALSTWVWSPAGNVTVNPDGSASVASLSSVMTTTSLPATGKWYWEVTATNTDQYRGYPVFGVSTSLPGYPGRYAQNCGLFAYLAQNYVEDNGVERFSSNSTIDWTVGVAYDAALRTVTFYRGGANVGTCVVQGSGATYPSAGAGAVGVSAMFTLNANPASAPTGYAPLAQVVTVPPN